MYLEYNQPGQRWVGTGRAGFLRTSCDSTRKGERMPNNNRQSHQRQTDDTNKNGLTPLTFPSGKGRRSGQWTEDDLLAEDDPLASNPPRPHTSAIRWNSQTTGRRGTGTRDISTETSRQHIPVPHRRT